MADNRAAAASLPKDGKQWLIGIPDDVDWIRAGTEVAVTVTAAIPPLFPAYATVVVPDEPEDRDKQDAALLRLLRRRSAGQSWWLGYLDTGADDVVFPEAAMVTLYSGWRYVFVQAGPDEAATWRRNDSRSWRGALPDVMFPDDRSWLVSYLWDDNWRCLGGPRLLVDEVVANDDLRGRELTLGEDATPPGRSSR